ncbi:MAG: primosomal protein N' [Firmicutes bacterium HGW-Firmicutes-1]|jgi:primosomal protein N' (replication factor Y)|nr:MAG: primosomal protein N' [Firmicutes bacterium HGW-Firmicutes-1]
MKKYANVILEISTKSLDRPFTYLIPEALQGSVDVGSIVTIPFGPSNRDVKGYVVSLTDQIQFDEAKLKSITNVNSSVNVESDLIKLAYWMQRRYTCGMQAALKSMIPSSQELNKKYSRKIKRNISLEALQKLIEENNSNMKWKTKILFFNLLINHDEMLEKDILQDTGISKSVLKTLEKNGFIQIEDHEAYRNPFNSLKMNKTEKIMPNYNQQKAIYKIESAVRDGKNEVFLLHGVTGSGKTEVYMQVIEQVISEGKQAIVLIPEIGLTPQTVSRFIGRFGDIIGVLHSKLSQGEKYDQWRKAKEGKISIMIGPRSAIFAPFERLGIIIIDEEHEMTYKSEMPPKYHAREVAIKRSSMSSCPVVLGSATPLIESYYKALDGKYTLLELTDKAIENASLSVDIVDMREELLLGNKSILSHSLKTNIEAALNRKEQIILFINRRGHSSFVSCRKCGYVVKCPSCDIPYTYHSNQEKMICHYCGNTINKIIICPNCTSKYIKEFGIGTQKVENYIKNEFKNAKVLRMDFDTTSRKNDFENILGQFENGDADILIGTQMVAKGHHFENVTVVGVIAADLSLYINDFRACERTFQLVTQVTGRTGRGAKKGKAIIQTYSPDHYSLQCAMEQNYKKFYHNEIMFREMMGYPPFSNIATILMSSKDEAALIQDAMQLKHLIMKLIDQKELLVLGPTPANVSKLKNAYRWRIIIKSKEYKALNQLLYELNTMILKDNLWQHMTINLDINSMMSN